MDNAFIPSLLELADKYASCSDLQVKLEDGAVLVDCNKGAYRFFYDFGKELPNDRYTNVPLYHWQQKRRYSELKGLLDRKMVEPALSMRIHHIVSHDGFTRTLKDILIFEFQLFEFITGAHINRVFADPSGDVYVNCILSTKENVKASMELGFSPDGSEPVLLHEVVARTGIASDLAVDIQMTQYPIYVLKGEKTDTYNEIDFELYGMDNAQADAIRFILWALTDITRVEALRQSYAHLEKVVAAVEQSGQELRYSAVEG